MRKTIQIGDKYEPLMDYYSKRFDKEEFNIFITRLLIAYKKMKDKNIDLITFSELIEPYNVDIIDLIKLITEHAEPSNIIPSMNGIVAVSSPALHEKKEERKGKTESQNSKVMVLKPYGTSKQLNSNQEKKAKDKSQSTEPINNPILDLGIDLSQ